MSSDGNSVPWEPTLATRLLSNSAVYLYHSDQILGEAIEALRGEGVYIVELDASTWESETDMHDALSLALGFPDYYGRNLNALNDCLGDIADRDNENGPNSTGMALTIKRYDCFAARDPGAAQALLDIWAGQARRGLLFGHRMLCSVQSNDPRLAFQPVGASPVMWNPAEWLESNRGL